MYSVRVKIQMFIKYKKEKHLNSPSTKVILVMVVASHWNVLQIHIILHVDRIIESDFKKCPRELSFKSRINIGTNYNRFLIVLQVTVRNLRDEGRMLYSLACNICVSSAAARFRVTLFTTCFSYRAVRVDCVTTVIDFTTDVGLYDALQIIFVF